jgi:CBS domain-containing protein
MGVSTSVSGSYLFNAPSIGQALMNLTKRDIESQFMVSDFMTPLHEAPFVRDSSCTKKSILETVENGNLGFCLVIDELNKLIGIVSSADIRKALLRKIDDPQTITPSDFMNRKPRTLYTHYTVYEMLQYIKKCPFSVMYLPVIDENQTVHGIVNFTHLIKGEL